MEENELDFLVSLDPIALWSEEGRAWLERFRSAEIQGTARRIFQAMVLFRKHDLEGACRLLDSAGEILSTLSEAEPSIVHVLKRWHLSALAYLHYLEGDLDRALSRLEEAHDEICRALSLSPFLVPVATHCIDFRIQAARIARRRNRWQEAREQIEAIREIYSDLRPFCILADGRSIALRDLRNFYLSLPLDVEQRKKLRYVLDDDYDHQVKIDRVAERIFALPDFVIPYP